MRFRLTAHSTIPTKRKLYWQVVFLPTLSLFSSYNDGNKQHFAMNLEWLFWSLTFLAYDND